MTSFPETLTIAQARRLALAGAGLLAPRRFDLPERAGARPARTRERCHRIIEHFGYLQLDTVAVSGARTHGIVLASRLRGLDAALAETLLAPGAPLFEYWGHEACWLPLSLYPCFAWRRRQYQVHPWWGDVLREHRGVAQSVLRRIEHEGPLRSLDLEGRGGTGWWDLKLTRRVAESLWLAGRLAIRERRSFQRSFDLVERVIPAGVRSRRVGDAEAFDTLLERALAGHGWASTGTLAATWRLVKCRDRIDASLGRLCEAGRIVPCALRTARRTLPGWVRIADLERLQEIERLRPRRGRGVLLSPFDPLLWDRARVQLLFDFEQRIEIYKPAHQRRYGYYCLPVLAGECLIGRVDLKARRAEGVIEVLSVHFERPKPAARDREALARALERFSASVGLGLRDPSRSG
ncbi:MAG: winged helix DNA-binding domain-containing protein [Thiotrichales bacterium]|nr:winged helix DNA-binding domain-containing protein [Thiotrichales bacterium]